MRIRRLWSVILVATLAAAALAWQGAPIFAQDDEPPEPPIGEFNPQPPEPPIERFDPDPPTPGPSVLDPEQPNYDPDYRYAPKGTFSDLPGERTASSSLLDENEAPAPSIMGGNPGFGTGLISNQDLEPNHEVWGVYAIQEIHPDLELTNNGDYLYAPTLLGPGPCPLESVTYYHKNDEGEMVYQWTVYNHAYGGWWQSPEIIDQDWLDTYEQDGFYKTLIYKDGDNWKAFLWDYIEEDWDEKYPTSYSTVDSLPGWDGWEAADMTAWPEDIPKIESMDLQVKISEDEWEWEPVDGTYGEHLNTLGGDTDCPYTRGHATLFWHWYVDIEYSGCMVPIIPVTAFVGRRVNNWTDMDISAYVPLNGEDPLDVNGVVLEVYNGALGVNDWGVRCKGSTDNRTKGSSGKNHCWVVVPLDSNDVFQYCVPGISPNLFIKLVGFTMADHVSLNTNAASITLSSTGAWETVDLSSSCPDAIGIIVEVYSPQTGFHDMGVRCYGSTDNRIATTYKRNAFSAIIGCDSEQRIQLYRENTNVLFYVTGYIESGAQFYTNGPDITPSQTNTWETIVDDSDVAVAFIEIDDDYYLRNYGLREYGASYEAVFSGCTYHTWGFQGTSGDKVEGKIENENIEMHLNGYAEK